VKRILICIAVIAAASGAVQASGVFACSGKANSSNSCYTSHLSTFDLQLNWDTSLSTSASSYVAPPIDGTNYNATWYASASFVNVTITGSNLIRGDDYFFTDTTGGGWQNLLNNPPNRVTGSFDSAPDTGLTTSGVGIPVNFYGEGLLGSQGMPGNNGGTFVVGSNTILSTFGFRIASDTNANFVVTINLFSSTDGSGTPLQTLTTNTLTDGGNCSSLAQLTPLVGGVPTPCNTAPFLYISTTGGVRSFSISTTDPTGFYIDSLDLYEPVPEPVTIVITGAGLLTLAFFLRRKRAAAARQ
jgi:hypothetical protein